MSFIQCFGGERERRKLSFILEIQVEETVRINYYKYKLIDGFV